MRVPATRIAVPVALLGGLVLATGCPKWRTIDPLETGPDQLGLAVLGGEFESCRPADRGYNEDGSPWAWRCYAQIAASTRDAKKKEWAAFLEMKPDGGWVLWHPNEHFDAKVTDENDEKIACVDQTEETKKAWEAREKAKKDEKKEGGEDDSSAPSPESAPETEGGPAPAPPPEPGFAAQLVSAPSASAEEGGEGGEGGASDEAGEGEAGAEDDDSWKEKPVLTVGERQDKAFVEKTRGKFCIEKAAGSLEADGANFRLLLPREHLPEGEVVVVTNGFWGLSVVDADTGEHVQIGSGREPGARIVSK